MCNIQQSKTSLFALLKSHFSNVIKPLLSYNKAPLTLQKRLFRSVREAVWLRMGGEMKAKTYKNSFWILQNRFLFCNRYLPFVRYLHYCFSLQATGVHPSFSLNILYR